MTGWNIREELAESVRLFLKQSAAQPQSLSDTIDGHFAEIRKAQDKEQTSETGTARTGNRHTARRSNRRAGASRRNSPGTGKRSTDRAGS
jgi:hypothetical protein